jgi:hypothetical protein
MKRVGRRFGWTAIRERGTNIVTILSNAPDCPTDGCPYKGEK